MPLTARCEASQWVAIIGPSSGAITAARPRPCCAALFPPANSFGSIRSPGSATCSAASQNIPSRGSKNCCRIVGLRHPDNPTPIHPTIRKPGPHPPEGFVGGLLRTGVPALEFNGDRASLETLLVSLIANAVESYGETSGEIRILIGLSTAQGSGQ